MYMIIAHFACITCKMACKATNGIYGVQSNDCDKEVYHTHIIFNFLNIGIIITFHLAMKMPSKPPIVLSKTGFISCIYQFCYFCSKARTARVRAASHCDKFCCFFLLLLLLFCFVFNFLISIVA